MVRGRDEDFGCSAEHEADRLLEKLAFVLREKLAQGLGRAGDVAPPRSYLLLRSCLAALSTNLLHVLRYRLWNDVCAHVFTLSYNLDLDKPLQVWYID